MTVKLLIAIKPEADTGAVPARSRLPPAVGPWTRSGCGSPLLLPHGLLVPEAALRHARVRRFAPSLGGGVAYTCKDLAESLAGKDRYEFANSSRPGRC
jgi:hypothetical protein